MWGRGPGDPLAAILRNVKGSNRRSMIRDYYAAGKLDELCSELLNDSLDEDTRRSLGRIHPSFKRIHPPSRLVGILCNISAMAIGGGFSSARRKRATNSVDQTLSN